MFDLNGKTNDDIVMATFCVNFPILIHLLSKLAFYALPYHLLTLPKHDGRQICTNFHLHIDTHKRTRLRICKHLIAFSVYNFVWLPRR